MANVNLIMPKMGESVVEATIITWLKNPGDKIEQDESVLEVATDKVDTEIPSTHAGILAEILAENGEVVKVGSPIAVISTTASQGIPEETIPPKPKKLSAPPHQTPITIDRNGANLALPSPFKSVSRFYSPLVKTIAKKENIQLAQLEAIPGTGGQGRVTKKDILAYLQQRNQKGNTGVISPAKPLTPIVIEPCDEIVQMDRMRKIIATRMVESKRVSPHVTSFVEADLTNLVRWRNKEREKFMQREKEPLTYTPVFVEAVVSAIRDFPMVNVQVDGDRIIKKKNINIGMAVALSSGNLIVPVIKNADQQNLIGLVKQVNSLARKARENKLNPDDLTNGTFTLSNVGSFGNLMGTPIILQPQVGIIAVGAIQKKPAVITTPDGDAIAIRYKMFLSHSYDHRVVDGALGGMFVRRVADYLEKFDMNQTI